MDIDPFTLHFLFDAYLSNNLGANSLKTYEKFIQKDLVYLGDEIKEKLNLFYSINKNLGILFNGIWFAWNKRRPPISDRDKTNFNQLINAINIKTTPNGNIPSVEKAMTYKSPEDYLNLQLNNYILDTHDELFYLSGWANCKGGHLMGLYYKKNTNDDKYTLVITNSGGGISDKLHDLPLPLSFSSPKRRCILHYKDITKKDILIILNISFTCKIIYNIYMKNELYKCLNTVLINYNVINNDSYYGYGQLSGSCTFYGIYYFILYLSIISNKHVEHIKFFKNLKKKELKNIVDKYEEIEEIKINTEKMNIINILNTIYLDNFNEEYKNKLKSLINKFKVNVSKYLEFSKPFKKIIPRFTFLFNRDNLIESNTIENVIVKTFNTIKESKDILDQFHNLEKLLYYTSIKINLFKDKNPNRDPWSSDIISINMLMDNVDVLGKFNISFLLQLITNVMIFLYKQIKEQTKFDNSKNDDLLKLIYQITCKYFGTNNISEFIKNRIDSDWKINNFLLINIVLILNKKQFRIIKPNAILLEDEKNQLHIKLCYYMDNANIRNNDIYFIDDLIENICNYNIYLPLDIENNDYFENWNLLYEKNPQLISEVTSDAIDTTDILVELVDMSIKDKNIVRKFLQFDKRSKIFLLSRILLNLFVFRKNENISCPKKIITRKSDDIFKSNHIFEFNPEKCFIYNINIEIHNNIQSWDTINENIYINIFDTNDILLKKVITTESSIKIEKMISLNKIIKIEIQRKTKTKFKFSYNITRLNEYHDINYIQDGSEHFKYNIYNDNEYIEKLSLKFKNNLHLFNYFNDKIIILNNIITEVYFIRIIDDSFRLPNKKENLFEETNINETNLYNYKKVLYELIKTIITDNISNFIENLFKLSDICFFTIIYHILISKFVFNKNQQSEIIKRIKYSSNENKYYQQIFNIISDIISGQNDNINNIIEFYRKYYRCDDISNNIYYIYCYFIKIILILNSVRSYSEKL